MKQPFKISLTLLLLASLTLSTVLGITQSESIGLAGIPFNSSRQGKFHKNTGAKHAFHRTRSEKGIPYEGGEKEEDNKGKKLEYVSFGTFESIFSFSASSGLIYRDNAVITRSRNILYCVFRI